MHFRFEGLGAKLGFGFDAWVHNEGLEGPVEIGFAPLDPNPTPYTFNHCRNMNPKVYTLETVMARFQVYFLRGMG